MTNTKAAWTEYTQSEISTLTPLLEHKGITLDQEQPHISGERFLMSGQKVVLVARDAKTGERLIIKSSADQTGIAEIEAERRAQHTLQKLPFAYHPLLSPQEVWYHKKDGRVTIATECIEQPQPYLSLPLTKQFDLILQAFTMLAGVHATTASHAKLIGGVVSTWGVADYQRSLDDFIAKITDPALQETLTRATKELADNQDDFARYCGFLTHDDFALHNFRFRDDNIYLIDQSSLRFGNKHESWARFMNYMLLYNRDLEQALTQYLQDNVAPEELRSLRLARIYKLVELLSYHHCAAAQSTGDVQKLSQRRVAFWHDVLTHILADTEVPEAVISSYRTDRDALRTTEELDRQRALQQLV